MRVLVVGASGAIARKLVARLGQRGHAVVGIDRRPWPDAPVEFHEVDVRKRAAEEVFRRSRAHAVVHMATVTSLAVPGEERHRINLGGTRAVFEHSRAYGVEHCVFVGRHTFYGAGPDVPLFHTEDEPPQELARFPELADLVAADLYAANALWRTPGLVTTVLRVCYTLGPTGDGTLARFLRGKHVPLVLGFDPLFQFMHEDDLVTALTSTVEARPRGVFNVAGPQPLPLSRVIRQVGRVPVPLPEFVLSPLLGRLGLPRLPAGAVAHVKYPVVVDARPFRQQTGFEPAYDELATLRSFAETFPAAGAS
ncbi:MAG TPA: SDR family oxidoreductase [Polyangiaceae bacterium]|nr:SDR family oxidoreductase [Polyangiaceae bacterium]